uniref:Uncharacterized protein n=1 Tax=Chromera velia CCMP2878 TaxID=1169474 RepID=A0A0G4HSJ0_9ALVE|eukprot:Cvel_31032.t1-p1 / transcript=Cvel_31032.t1 / gene=Cvel_31032 / organism=Chromera_velia_CCMP2878 / gene_product=hypothetical protein / transcript_product=hypothetical protein / location=Cvel_scaffold4543:2923-3807(-) / protein_length=295 / sequence_SO=supercontig / SO=protein_coding / is_pseudo=false
MCCLALAYFVIQPEAVVALLAARETALGGKEGMNIIRLAFEGTVGWSVKFGRKEAEQRLIETLKTLAEKEAELSRETRSGDLLGQALIEACERSMEGVVVSLLQMGVSPKRMKAGASVPLVVCLRKRKWSMAKRLLKGEADPNEADERGVSAVEAYLKAAEAYLKAAAGQQRDQLGLTVLEEMAKVGANFNAPLQDGHTPMSFAIIEMKLKDEADFLFHNGASLQGKRRGEGEEDVRGLLMTCILTHQWALAKWLLAWGADPNEFSISRKRGVCIASLPLVKAMESLQRRLLTTC